MERLRGTGNDRELMKCIFCKRQVRLEAFVVMPSICSTPTSRAKRKRLEHEERANDQLMFEQYEIQCKMLMKQNSTKNLPLPPMHPRRKELPSSLPTIVSHNPRREIPTPTPSYKDPNARIKLRNKHQEHPSLQAYLPPQQ
jgi:hypothetical protein